MFADDQILIQDDDNTLQLETYMSLSTEYNMAISRQKTKIMVFKGCEPVRYKIVIVNRILEEVNNLLNHTSYDFDRDLDSKLNKFRILCPQNTWKDQL